MYNKKNNVPFASRRELVLSVAFACFAITLFGLCCEFTEMNKAVLAVCVVFVYLIIIAALGVLRQKQQNAEPHEGMYQILEETSSTVLKNTTQPIATFDPQGTILWCNEAMLSVLRLEDNPIGMNLETVFGDALTKDTLNGDSIVLRSSIYRPEAFILSDAANPIYMLSLTDITAISEMEKKYNENKI